ncbi:hypothetical protein PENARI_c005G10448 [Penicillium arizonense]|uniref:FMN hydroxy acid dehydrogenase domain-containing protein n=1 Tax=Penicillium arizonense TaxID=1835702 RepID=A0A1F5LPP2_PENAI|nr:hypothetical protein PENARI_c005G10448 [Penicillium arizonense]OGE55066.1 hypothetical protein PENARI_c005G10448 [Penicillium arizonense]
MHPGGASSILQYAGKARQDATEEYDAIHTPGTIESSLSLDKCLGELENQTDRPPTKRQEECPTPDGNQPTGTPIQLIACLDDFELAAKKILNQRSWIYYSSSAGSMESHARNLADWSKVTFRPRVLRNVEHVNMGRTILGHPSNAPFFIAPCALGRLGHPDGEHNLVRGAAKYNIPYTVSNASSVSATDLAKSLRKESGGGSLFFQLYVKRDPAETRKSIEQAKSLGYGALLVTVDTPVVGKRDASDRFASQQALQANSSELPVAGPLASHGSGVPRGPYSSTLTWADLQWIAQEWGNAGPLCLKGITTVEDARLALDMGYTSLYLSNHGGRQLDGAPSALETLLEIRQYDPEILQLCEILVDGGIRKGGDVLKALALGANAVGLGRPFMFALILLDEIQTDMRLLGITDLAQLGPSTINTRELQGIITQQLGNDMIGHKRFERAKI